MRKESPNNSKTVFIVNLIVFNVLNLALSYNLLERERERERRPRALIYKKNIKTQTVSIVRLSILSLKSSENFFDPAEHLAVDIIRIILFRVFLYSLKPPVCHICEDMANGHFISSVVCISRNKGARIYDEESSNQYKMRFNITFITN